MSENDALAKLRFQVGDAAAGRRLDLVLCDELEGVSRTRVQELIRDGGVLVDDEVELRPGATVDAGQFIACREVVRSRERRGGIVGALEVVFEDEHVAVIEKPAGLVAHPSSIVRGGTVSELATERWGQLPSPQGEDRPGIVHRLDSDTSGLLVLAKTELAATSLLAQFKARTVEKSYEALAFGETRFHSDWIETPLGRSKRRSDRMSVMPEGEGLAASTYYETLLRARGFSHLLLRPKTGRTHQLRVHMASIDHPLVGDGVYRGRRGLHLSVPKDAPAPDRHSLHAARLAFDDPASGERRSFASPLPADMKRFVGWMRATDGA